MDVTTTAQLHRNRLDDTPWDSGWDVAETPEAAIHRIHGYPAKFPAFLTTKSIQYAESIGLSPRRIGDVFCGSGTVAQEARNLGLEFWGCDVNPVATMIARAKSTPLRADTMRRYAREIVRLSSHQKAEVDISSTACATLLYWFGREQFDALARILNAIRTVVSSRSTFLDAFYCAFSAILKNCSQWKKRANKPTFDAQKVPPDALRAFERQCRLLCEAFEESSYRGSRATEIHLADVLSIAPPNEPVDILVTSPPYVTSYDYADLHQLSALWLGFADDHRALRVASIGSAYREFNFERSMSLLNRTGTQVVFSLYNEDRRLARSVAKYYVDMQQVARRSRSFMSNDAIAVFIVGNTRYDGVEIDNATHLAESLLDAGFGRIRAVKRRISNKSATPFRRDDGRFSRTRTESPIYDHEFVLIAHP